MKIGVISDTHIPANAQEIPRQVLEDFATCDMILAAGDLVDLKVLEALRKTCPEVVAVYGNMDSPAVRAKLRDKAIVSAGKYRIGLTHGFGHPADLVRVVGELFKPDRVDVIVFGHSHIPLNEKKDGILYFNPGSPTDRVFAPYNSYGIIEAGKQIKAKIIKI